LEDNLRNWIALLLGTALAALTVGCGGGGGGGNAGGGGAPVDTVPPSITATSATSPASSDGGPVPVTATVTDAGGVKEVYALITLPGGGSERVNMFLTSGAIYQGTFNAPANYEFDPALYIVIVNAADKSDNYGASFPFNFEVPGFEFPPPPPEEP